MHQKKLKKALKFDNGKSRIELVPPEFIVLIGDVLRYGGLKYSPGNWAVGDGFDHSRLYGALQRHLNAYWSGVDNDDESGLSHLGHAACMLAFLYAHKQRGLGKDDRVTIGATPAKPRKRK